MKTFIVAALLALSATSCAAATLKLAATVPTQDNAGACTAQVLGPSAPGSIFYILWVWYGAEVDSTQTGPYVMGQPAALVREVKPGIYTRYDAIASHQGGASCRTSIQVRDTLRSRPASPTLWRAP